MIKNKETGISVVELLVAIALIGFIAAVTLGYSMRTKDRWNIKNNAREITTSYYKIKQNAVTENRPIWATFDSNGYEYLSWDEGDSKWVPLTKAGFFKGENKANVTLENDVEFVISSLGMILEAPGNDTTDPSTLAVASAKVIRLKSQGYSGVDVVDITIYPYGGIKIENDFKN